MKTCARLRPIIVYLSVLGAYSLISGCSQSGDHPRAAKAPTTGPNPSPPVRPVPLADTSDKPLRGNARIDSIFVRKSLRRMSVHRDGKLLKTYRVALGRYPVGPKMARGDHKTPEGLYYIDMRVAQSAYHLALHISYPNPADRRRASKLGVNPGGDIMIHGLPNGYGAIGKRHADHDWTYGCIAVTDPEIEELWRSVPDGTPVTIAP